MGTQTFVEVTTLVSQIANRPTDQLGPSMGLGTDPGLDSIGLVELLAMVETELGVFLDEGLVSGSTSISKPEAIAAQGDTSRGKSDQPKWQTGTPGPAHCPHIDCRSSADTTYLEAAGAIEEAVKALVAWE